MATVNGMSPDDYEDFGQQCDHEAYTISWDGRAECDDCGHAWWARKDEIERYDRSMAIAPNLD